MSIPRTLVVAALVAGVSLGPGALGADDTESVARFAIGFHAWPDGLERGGSYEGARIEAADPALRMLVVETQDADALVAKARQDARVRYLEADTLQPLLRFAPNDPRYTNGDQYGPQHVQAPAAWDLTLGATSARVCIVDSGVRRSHEDIPSDRYLGGYDYWNEDSDPDDQNGHGTHVSGILLARTNNAKGIAGLGAVSWQHVRVTNANGEGYVSDIALGIRWCKDNGAHVVSMSLGVPSGTSGLQDAVGYAWSGGVVLAAASGNDGCSNCVNYPAAYTNVIAVACTDDLDDVCYFSSGGPQVDIAAPGYDIVAPWHTSNTAYVFRSGTSMSAPHVGGALGLIKSYVPTATNQELRDRLLNGARDIDAAGIDVWTGRGLLRVDESLKGTPPALPSLACAPEAVATGRTLACTVSAQDADGGQVHFTVDWGDGAIERWPASGGVDEGADLVATHRYDAPMTAVLLVSATDLGPDAQTGPTASTTVAVVPNAAPAAPLVVCAPSPSALGQNVTCTLSAADDSDGVSFELDWDDGSPAVRLPATGVVAPGSSVSATRALTAAGVHAVRARAQDDATPSLEGPLTTAPHDVRDCSFHRFGQLTAGVPVHVDGVSIRRYAGVPEACWGITYEGDSNTPLADIDVCWLAGSVSLGCNTGADPEQGKVPAGATTAEIRLRTGALANVSLRVPAPDPIEATPPPPPPPDPILSDDDGEVDHFALLDSSGDRATKRLRVPTSDYANSSLARLRVVGHHQTCAAGVVVRTPTHMLWVNGAPVLPFSPCSAFGPTTGEAFLTVPLASLLPGTTNSFRITKPIGASGASDLQLGVDGDRDNGNSDISLDGAELPGELMFRLELIRL